jgi:hypothetical protein
VCESILLVIHHAQSCAVLYCLLWPVRLNNIFPPCLIFSTNFEKKKYCTQNVSFDFVCNLFFLNISHSKKNSAIYLPQLYTSLHVRYPFFLSDSDETFNILHKFSENNRIPNYMKTSPVVAEMFHADGQTDRHDETNRRFT